MLKWIREEQVWETKGKRDKKGPMVCKQVAGQYVYLTDPQV